MDYLISVTLKFGTHRARALWFYNPYSPTCRNNFPSSVGYFQIRIGDHCFYNPAPSYANT